MAIYPFITFNGKCEEAMRFYQSCFGGQLRLRYLKDGPFGSELPTEMHDLIVQASLESDHIRLLASDLGASEGLYAGNSISLLISMSAGERLRRVFGQLARQGEVTAPLTSASQKGQWATVTDKYLVNWIFELA